MHGQSQEHQRLADALVDHVGIQEEIMQETLQSAKNNDLKESGRTICGGTNVKDPIGRFPRSVKLPECPSNSTGIMHSHVSIDQLQNPEHSLPDISNVIIGDVDASLIVGTQTHDLMVAPADPQEALVAFQDAIGLEVESTEDIVVALRDGRIPNAPDARRRVRSRLSHLFETIRSDLSHMDTEVDRVANAIPARGPIVTSFAHEPLREEDSHMFVEYARKIQDGFVRNQDVVDQATEGISKVFTPENLVNIAATSIVTSIITNKLAKANLID